MDDFETTNELLAQGARALRMVKFKLMHLQHTQDQLHAAMGELMAQASRIVDQAAPTQHGDAPPPPLLKKDPPL